VAEEKNTAEEKGSTASIDTNITAGAGTYLSHHTNTQL
jgi:hypothetical protein